MVKLTPIIVVDLFVPIDKNLRGRKKGGGNASVRRKVRGPSLGMDREVGLSTPTTATVTVLTAPTTVVSTTDREGTFSEAPTSGTAQIVVTGPTDVPLPHSVSDPPYGNEGVGTVGSPTHARRFDRVHGPVVAVGTPVLSTPTSWTSSS